LTGILATTLTLSGCKSAPEEKENTFLDEWRARAKESLPYAPGKTDHAAEALAGLPAKKQDLPQTQTLQKDLPTRTITMKMNDIDISVLLRALARVANQNIILSDKVSGKININLTKAKWDEVFISLLRTYGLTYAWEGDIIRILTVEDMETELKREAQRIELSKVEPLVTRIIQVRFTEAPKLKVNLEKFLSTNNENQQLGSVMVDDHTNSLIIQAIPDDMRRIMAVIDQLDQPTDQVLIEAHIVEANSDTARALGVQWGGLGLQNSGDRNYWLGQGDYNFDESLFFGEDSDNPGAPVVFLPPVGNVLNFPVNLPDGEGVNLGFLYQDIGNMVLTFQLKALEDEGQLNILSSPSITTLENQSAFIESGARVPIQTVENGEVEVRYEKAVLNLEVVPHVIDKDTLKLKIVTNKDELDFNNTVSGNPTIITKRAETSVIVFNGQTTVIGGLGKETSTRGSSGVPHIKDVPGLGYLFGSRSKADIKEELLIFITPYILKEKKTASKPSTGSDLISHRQAEKTQ
jgi:type IV pilus assembly protein PilQ